MLRALSILIPLFLSACSTVSLSDLKNLERQAKGEPTTPSPGESIVNGVPLDKDSDYGQRTALLMMEKNGGTSICTAVPIGTHLLLTAAHCVYQLKPEQLKVVFNENNHVPVEKYKVHESYDGTAASYSDLALLKLKSPLPADSKIVPTFDGKTTSFDDQLILTGYGITDEHAKDSLVLRMTSKSYKNDVFIKNSLIGFNQKNVTGGFCKGDSGAPIFVRQGSVIKLIGVNSFTAGAGEDLDCRTASFAMYIPHFRNWIIKESIKL